MAIFTGTAGDDSILGTSAGDDFHLEQGGEDSASGGAGIDIFYMGASFDSGDRLDGGTGRDNLVLDGDYSAGVEFTARDLRRIETVTLVSGNDYVLTSLENVRGRITVDAASLGAGDHLAIDATGRANSLAVLAGAGDDSIVGGDGGNVLTGGDGSDTLVGGAGDDHIDGGSGNNLLLGGKGKDIFAVGGASDTVEGGQGADRIEWMTPFDGSAHIDGGTGADRLWLQAGVTGPVLLDASHIQHIESLALQGQGLAYDITIADDLLSSQAFVTQAFNVGGLRFDGSQETDARLIVEGSTGADTLLGGAQGDELAGMIGDDSMVGGGGDDSLQGGPGHDTLVGGSGDDFLAASYGPGSVSTLIGGLGADTLAAESANDYLVYSEVADSTVLAPDRVEHLANSDVIDLGGVDADSTQAGDQAFHLVSSLSGHAGELALVYDSVRDITNLEGDVDGDGQADLLIILDGDQTAYTNFVL